MKFYMPVISIIIPLYNQHKKLLACLQSIKNQTFQNYEVIIVNDGSTDIDHNTLRTGAILRVTDVRCAYQPNQGAPIARNNGFAQSHGQYVIFCDADVIMQPTMLEKMNRVLDENPDISYVYSSFKFGWKKFRLWEFSAERLRQMPYIHTTSLMRREVFPGFDPSLKRFQDWDLWLAMLKKGYKGKWIDETLYQIKSGGKISNWMPSFFIKHDKGYMESAEIVKQKHKGDNPKHMDYLRKNHT